MLMVDSAVLHLPYVFVTWGYVKQDSFLMNDRMELCLLSGSFHGKEVRSSPKRRSDGRLSRTSSTEKEPCGEGENKKEAEENKENMRLDEYYNDPDSWNESVISGESHAL